MARLRAVLQHFDRERRGFAAADAQRRDAALEAALLQRADQRGDDMRVGRADRVAERTGTAVHVDLVVRQFVFLHRRYRLDRERFVDLLEIDVGDRPAGLVAQGFEYGRAQV